VAGRKGTRARGKRAGKKRAAAQRTLTGRHAPSKRRIRQDQAHQLWYGRRTLEKHGVPTDLGDWESEFDFTLTYAENYCAVILPMLEQHSERWKLKRMMASYERARARLPVGAAASPPRGKAKVVRSA